MKIRLRRAPRAERVAAATKPSRLDRGRVMPQYMLPKRRLTQLAGRIASSEGRRSTQGTIRWFVRKYGVDMSEAVEPDVTTYKSFNDFFTRALRPEVRPLAETGLVCPVDGTISQFGRIDHDQIMQAKGRRYATATLLGGDVALAKAFHHGHFATLYLSPRDYHRIHMPCDGRLVRMIHVPGDLFSVNPLTARGVPGLFARNERVVCVFEGADGPFVIVLVGATIVGSMATVWHGVINAPRVKRVREWTYGVGEAEDIVLARGAEMGRFLLGSTVVLLFPEGPLVFNPTWAPGKSIRFGEAMAEVA